MTRHVFDFQGGEISHRAVEMWPIVLLDFAHYEVVVASAVQPAHREYGLIIKKRGAVLVRATCFTAFINVPDRPQL